MPSTPAHTVLVLPFENDSKAPGIQWISEAFPETLSQRMASPTLYLISREDRLKAFDRAGIPVTVNLSHATLYRIAEQIDCDYMVVGHFNFDGQTFTTSAQIMNLKSLRFLPQVREAGPLVKLIEVQTALAWDLLQQLAPAALPTQPQFVAGFPPIRLDAFENYVRGVEAASPQEQIRRLREAIRLNPQYTAAIFQLGKTYYSTRDYENAANWLARVPHDDSHATEASFYLGMSAYYSSDFARAESAFGFLTQRLPLTEVFNNLGVVAGRRGRRNAADYFQKAMRADPADPDYRFNLAVALYRNGDLAGASRQLREALSLLPSDNEARALLDSVTNPALRPAEMSAGSKIPLERIKRNYDETAFRQVALEIQNAVEQRLSQTDAPSHAQYHVDRGREMLAQGFAAEAEKAFREAVLLDPTNFGAHTGLALVLEGNAEFSAARNEARTSLRLKSSAEALLLLARLDLKDNNREAALRNINDALALEPANPIALGLKKTIEEKP